MGFDVSFHKGQFGQKVDWVGYTIQSAPEKILISIKEDFMEELASSTAGLLKRNFIKVKDLRPFYRMCEPCRQFVVLLATLS